MAVDGVNLKGDTGSIYFRRHTEVVAVKTQSEPGILGRDELQTGSVPLDKLYRAYAVELALIAESVGCHSIFISKEAVVAIPTPFDPVVANMWAPSSLRGSRPAWLATPCDML